jgi:hypothetical protein
MKRRIFIKPAALSTGAAMLPLAAQSGVEQQKSKPIIPDPIRFLSYYRTLFLAYQEAI